MYFEDSEYEEFLEKVRATGEVLPCGNLVRIPDGLEVPDRPHVSGAVLKILRSADFVDTEAGAVAIFTNFANLVFSDDGVMNPDMTFEVIVTIGRFLFDLMVGLDDESRQSFFGHLDELVESWTWEFPSPWYDDEAA
jgi:hypothetical protein